MSDSHSRAADAELSAKGRSFHWARRFLGERHAERATRLYMLCRYVDDIADEADSGSDARRALVRMKQDIRAGRSSDPIVADGIRLFAECGIEPGIFTGENRVNGGALGWRRIGWRRHAGAIGKGITLQ